MKRKAELMANVAPVLMNTRKLVVSNMKGEKHVLQE